MKARRLGRSALMIPPVVFGGNVFGWTADEKTSLSLLDALSDMGLTAIDTADVYSNWIPGHAGGESEAIIGRWMKARGNRDRVVVATKVGMRMGHREGLSAAWIAEAVEASLRRLQTDYIDLYQAHVDDPDVPLEESLSALSRLVGAGKVRAIGCSNYTAARLDQALRVSAGLGLARFESVQPHYNLIHRDEFEGPLSELCAREEVGAISYFGLAAGFLSGKYRSAADIGQSSRADRVASYMTPRNLTMLETLLDVAREEATTPSAVAIAWLMGRPNLSAPIVSATSLAQLEDIRRAVDLRLSSESLRRLESIGPAAGR